MGNVNKNIWVFIVVMAAGLVVGGFIGTIFENVPYCSWLNYGKSFGFSQPVVLDFDIIVFSFALSLKFTISGIIGLIIAIIVYKKI